MNRSIHPGGTTVVLEEWGHPEHRLFRQPPGPGSPQGWPRWLTGQCGVRGEGPAGQAEASARRTRC